MAEYIAREALDAEIRRQIDECKPMSDGRFYGASFLATIECAPAADVAEVVHGRWIRGGADDMHGFDFHCSECNKSFHLGSLATVYDVEREWTYCPNCGCKMGEGE